MLKKSVVEHTLEAALETGADFAELYVEQTKRNHIAMVNGQVETALGGLDYGAGIRLFCGNRVIYAFVNDTSEENLVRTAREMASTVKGTHLLRLPDWKTRQWQNINPIFVLPDDVEKRKKADYLAAASAAAFAYDPAITQTRTGFLDVTKNVLVANSEGVWAEERRVRSRFTVEAVASSATEKQSGHLGPGGSVGFELFDQINVEDTAREAARNASVFAGKLGQQIASPLVTAIDDGTIPNGWGSANMDDEGTPTRRNVLIENGVLKTYLVDRMNGRKMGAAVTGSARRENYRFAPTSRMTNTFLAPGNSTPESIIADTPYGLYAKQMGGGSVDPATGAFNFAVLEAYIIRNGQICEPVRGATLIGKGAEVLMQIDKVGNNLKRAQGMCGSISGSIPTDVGQPMIRVKEMTVGGRG